MDDESAKILDMTAAGILGDYKGMGQIFTPEQEARFVQHVRDLVNAEPPENEQIWQTIDVLLAGIRAGHREEALRACNLLMLEFISGCDPSSTALLYLTLLNQAKDAVKAGHFDQAAEHLMAFLARCREAVQSQ